MQTFYIIGISDNRNQFLSPEIRNLVSQGKVFSGGKRHHELVHAYLPEDAVWIDITVPLDAVFCRYEEHPEIIVFASGDPLFFGFANTVMRKLPSAKIILFPTFNSLQMLAHRILLPYQEMQTLSLTGRPWDAFDSALIRGDKLIGVLTDREKTPATIAARMLEYGYDNYRMTVGEALGNGEEESVRTFSLEEASQSAFRFPNCLILQRNKVHPRPFGIPESEFHLLNGRNRMITKMPVRLLTLSMLTLREKKSFWDIGFCTVSVSIEAKLQFPELKVTAFEQRPEGKELMERNSRKYNTNQQEGNTVYPYCCGYLESDRDNESGINDLKQITNESNHTDIRSQPAVGKNTTKRVAGYPYLYQKRMRRLYFHHILPSVHRGAFQ